MIEMILVSIGGFFGAISRYAINKKIQGHFKSGFPLGTLTVNLVGAFLLGLLYGYVGTGHFYTLIGVGFMGAFTTFSTFKLESEELRKTKQQKKFFGYLIISYTFGILLAFFGISIGKII